MNVEKLLAEWGLQLMWGDKIPMSASYHPELDVFPELDPEEANYFQSMIGILCWVVELRHVDIVTEVSMLSAHLVLQRRGHFEAALILPIWSRSIM